MTSRAAATGSLISLVVLCATTASTLAQTTWKAGTGDWFHAANWSNGVPGSQPAEINNGGTAQITAPGAAASVTLGSGATDSGNLSISGSGHLDGTITAGNSGTGAVSITAGGVVRASRFLLGVNGGSTGTATVSGPGSAWINDVVCFVGFDGNATLNITNGGQVSDSSASVGGNGTGLVTIDGAGSIWNNNGTVTVGGGGHGTVNILNGGTFFTDGSGGSFGCEVGENPGSDGLVSVSGSGSSWTNNGSVSVGGGFAGTSGSLHVSYGGAVSSSYAIVGGMGAHGAAIIQGAGSTWTIKQALSIAPYSDDGALGTLMVTQGATVSSGSGALGPGSATVAIDGAHSAWTNTGDLVLGKDDGTGAPAILRITHGGTASAAATTVYKMGMLQLGKGAIKGPLTFRGGSIQTLNNINVLRTFVIGTGGLRVQTGGYHSTFSGNISGVGGLTKTAVRPLGSLTLAGSNTYTGPTSVNGGALLVDGSITSASTVNNSGVLGGGGTVGSVKVNDGGTVAPGNGVGRLTVKGTYSQASGGNLAIELGGHEAGTQFDQLVVTGAAQVAGVLNVTLVNGFHPAKGDTFQIVTSASEVGNFSTVGCDGFTASSEATANGIKLTVLSVASP